MIGQRYKTKNGGGYFFRGDYDITEPGKDASLATIDLADWRTLTQRPGTKIQLTAILHGTELRPEIHVREKEEEGAEAGREVDGAREGREGGEAEWGERGEAREGEGGQVSEGGGGVEAAGANGAGVEGGGAEGGGEEGEEVGGGEGGEVREGGQVGGGRTGGVWGDGEKEKEVIVEYKLECPGCKERVKVPEEVLEVAKTTSKRQKARAEEDRIKWEKEKRRRAKWEAAGGDFAAIQDDEEEPELPKKEDDTPKEEEKVPEVFETFEW